MSADININPQNPEGVSEESNQTLQVLKDLKEASEDLFQGEQRSNASTPADLDLSSQADRLIASAQRRREAMSTDGSSKIVIEPGASSLDDEIPDAVPNSFVDPVGNAGQAVEVGPQAIPVGSEPSEPLVDEQNPSLEADSQSQEILVPSDSVAEKPPEHEVEGDVVGQAVEVVLPVDEVELPAETTPPDPNALLTDDFQAFERLISEPETLTPEQVAAFYADKAHPDYLTREPLLLTKLKPEQLYLVPNLHQLLGRLRGAQIDGEVIDRSNLGRTNAFKLLTDRQIEEMPLDTLQAYHHDLMRSRKLPPEILEKLGDVYITRDQVYLHEEPMRSELINRAISAGSSLPETLRKTDLDRLLQEGRINQDRYNLIMQMNRQYFLFDDQQPAGLISALRSGQKPIPEIILSHPDWLLPKFNVEDVRSLPEDAFSNIDPADIRHYVTNPEVLDAFEARRKQIMNKYRLLTAQSFGEMSNEELKAMNPMQVWQIANEKVRRNVSEKRRSIGAIYT